MATTPTKPDIEMADPLSAISVPGWTKASNSSSGTTAYADERPAPQNALQALLAFSALEEQVVIAEFRQLVGGRAASITGADGLAIALAENSEIVLRAAAGTIRPDVG